MIYVIVGLVSMCIGYWLGLRTGTLRGLKAGKIDYKLRTIIAASKEG